MLCRILFLLYLLNVILCIDYYELLGIQKDAENRDIRKAFKKLALIYHPDKNQEKEAHEKFIEINKAYEVLTDEGLRRKYDLYGEDGLKANFFGNSWQGNYHSWNYYHENFGIYDDDPEIVTLGSNDFERLVLDSPFMWFVNFYSPQCSHCHLLAPTWRKLARELKDVIQIGAVNCEEDWSLCRRQNIFAYPSLILYTSSKNTKYPGSHSRNLEDLVEYVLLKLPYNVIHLTSANYKREISSTQIQPLPWLIFSSERSEYVSKDDLKKLGIILEHLVYVAKIDDQEDKLCGWLFCESPVTYYSHLTANSDKNDLHKIVIEDMEVSEIVNKVLHLLPDLQEISNSKLKEIKKESSLHWLIQFTKRDTSSTDKDIPLKRIKSFLPEINFGSFNCYCDSATCKSFYINKFPSFVLFKSDGSYEIFYGRTSAHEISSFVREALKSKVVTLTPEDFPKVTESEEIWFIDFFAPKCPACLKFLSQYRKASQKYSPLVKFGTLDCSVHHVICRKNNINSYPSAFLYKNSVAHQFHGIGLEHEFFEVLDVFIQELLNPVVISLSPSSFQEVVYNKNIDDLWMIDFSIPRCVYCQELAPEWRKLAIMMKDVPSVHIGKLDCTLDQNFCTSLGIRAYPHIRLYPRGEGRQFYIYQGYSRDASSLQAWLYKYLSLKVTSLTDDNFDNKVLEDFQPWVVEFFAPWCVHCQTFAPEFEKIAEMIEGKVKAGKVNCNEHPKLCRAAAIRAFPSVAFYKGRTFTTPQSPVPEVIQPFSFDNVIAFLENKFNFKFTKSPLRDEL